MRPTRYNSKITVQKPTTTKNKIGGWKNDYVTLEWSFTDWASVVPVKGLKKIEYTKLGYTTIYEVEMRSRQTNPDGDCRVIMGGNSYQIVAIQIDGDKVNMDIGRTD